MTPVLTPGSRIRAAYDSAVAAGRGAQADYFVRRGYDCSALDANVLAALATWGYVEVGSSLPHASRQGNGAGPGDTCLCIRPASSGRWSKSRASREHSLAAGNCQPITDSFARSAWSAGE